MYLVSAIVSVYKAEKFIRGCLEDLEAQTIADSLEIIVVDSNSPENEGKIVKEFQKHYNNIKYIRTPERESIYKSWNRAIKVASGEYITNANADDRHRKDAFEVMLRAFESHPEVVLVYGDCLITTKPNETFEQNSAHAVFRWWDWNRNWLLDHACFMGPQPMWKKRVHEVFGYFDEELKQSGDYEFWLRISQIYDFYHIPEVLGLYYFNPQGVEHSNHATRDQENESFLSLYREAAEEGRIIRYVKLEGPKLVSAREIERELLEKTSWWQERKKGKVSAPPRGTLFSLT